MKFVRAAALLQGEASAKRETPAPLSGGRRRLEGQREAVHAIAQACRLGSIIEDMAEMAVAAPATYRGADHAEGTVLVGADRIVERGPEARPAGAAVELGRGGEQVEVAAGAGENALPMLIQKRTAERRLRPFLAQDRVLLGGELAAPFGV